MLMNNFLPVQQRNVIRKKNVPSAKIKFGAASFTNDSSLLHTVRLLR
jgi:hypothetical protein